MSRVGGYERDGHGELKDGEGECNKEGERGGKVREREMEWMRE